ncbi:MAG: AMP-binding protein [Candidatus Omnitrophica bacterium]|nr:AMP-binding protein [Candidatus Omnitrophota bacterium]
MDRNLPEKFKKISSEYSNQIAIKYKKDNKWATITYGDFNNTLESLCNFLLTKNIKKDDKIAILLKNRPEWPLVFFASLSIGAACVPMNPELTQKEIQNILNNSESKIVFTDDGFLRLKKEILQNCPSVKEVISVDSESVWRPTRSPNVSSDRHADPGDTACILYTSGTTDEPKGVMLSHKNLLSNCESLYKLNLITRKDSVVSILPLHHTYPLTITMLLPLLYGGMIVYPGTLRGEAVLQALKETNPTVFVAVPQIFYTFHQKIVDLLKNIPFPLKLLLNATTNLLYRIRRKTRINLSRYLFFSLQKKFGKSMRLFVSGGAKLDENVEQDLFKFGFTILEGYGLTETSPVLALNPLKNPKIGSVGLAIPEVELRIINKDENGLGEVIARGPNIMEGYYKRSDLTADVIKDGWFYTGDLGFFDKDGYLFLTGRSKDIIVLSSGKNIYPEEIEEAYSKDVPAEEICVFEVPSKKGAKETEVLWAVIVPDLKFFKKYGEVNLKNVIKERIDNVSRSLPPHKRLMGFSITLDELPRTLLGKVKRFAVKEIYIPKILEEEKTIPEKEDLSREDRELVNTYFGKKIIDYLKKTAKVDKAIVPANSLELDLGIDSLGRIDLAFGLEKLFGTEIEDEIIGRSFTVKDLILGCMESLLPKDTKTKREGKKGIDFGPDYWVKLLRVPPKKESLDKIDLNPGFGAWLGGFIFTLLHWLVYKLFYSLKVEGKENFPESGPYILYVNHSSYFDGFLVAVSLPKFPRLELFFVGFRPYFTVPIIRNLVKIGRIIPLDFSSHLLEALRSSYYVVKKGKSLCLFPEGLRTLDGEIKEFKKGFGILVKETQAKLVPVVLEGAYEAWPRTSKFPRRHPIKVKFGKPRDPGDMEREGYKMGAKDSYEAICLAARDVLVTLKETTTYGGRRPT